MQKNKKITLIALSVFLVLVAAFASGYYFLKPQGQEGAKTINVSIIIDEAIVKTIEINTEAAFLRQALEERELIEGEETLFGLMVTSVDGRTADSGNQEWWKFTKDGEFLVTGVDDTPIESGDNFEITLVTGW